MFDIEKTIVIVASCDTKYKEASYMRERVEAAGIRALVADVATGPGPSYGFDISREETAAAGGSSWETVKAWSKGEKIAYMGQAAACLTRKLYRDGRLDGILAAGGLQNTVMAVEAMGVLPIGIPKVIATTIACGSRKFETVAGEKDIVMIPSICDFTGMNMITEKILKNACACCCGMVSSAGGALEKSALPVVGVSLMGVTNKGACGAIACLEEHGVEAIGFHTTGVGGAVMEELAFQGLLDGILDMSLHEITSEYFRGGFSYNERAKIRLRRAAARRVPLVAAPGGLDFVDFMADELPGRMDERAYMMHNRSTAHIKILPDEAQEIGQEVRTRLEDVDYPVKLLLPTEGMRSDTGPGQLLCRPEVDRILIGILGQIQNPNVEIITVPGNLDTETWGRAAALHMIETLKRRQIIKNRGGNFEENCCGL